jgi:DNA-binding response OmpR family regulator
MPGVIVIEDDDRIRRSLIVALEDEGYAVRGAATAERVWEYEFGDERLVDVHVARLRQKIEDDPGTPDRLVTVRGLGYKLHR